MSGRTAAFDLALAAGVAALGVSSPLPLVVAAPYGWALVHKAWYWRRHGPAVTAADLAADLVGLGALVLGSLRSRSPLL